MAHSLRGEWEVLSWHRNGRTTILPKCGPLPHPCAVSVSCFLYMCQCLGEGRNLPLCPPT